MGIIGFWVVEKFANQPGLLSPGNLSIVSRPKPLLAYTYENLKQRQYLPSKIAFEKLTFTDSTHTVWQISFQSDGKKVSGLANLPVDISTSSAFIRPVIILVRGFASQIEYYPGFGTERVAKVLASNGFVVLAPDFLGYGSSDKPSLDVFEERFQVYVTVLNLISSVCSSEFVVRSQNTTTNNYELITNNCQLGIWGHSNGGQIALSVLEISGKNIPTVLWNPVSKPFPYSILYYTDDFDDRGKELRKVLADFEKDYDVELYSLVNFLDWINTPILLQQGGADQSVQQKWSDDLMTSLKSKAKKVEYKVYPGADHNMLPNWGSAASDALNFYRSNL